MSRVLILAKAYLAGEWMGERGARLPIAPVLFQAFIAAVLCGLVRGELPPLPYTIFALSIPLGLTSLSLRGELAPLLRADPAAEWVGAQPVRPVELRAARVMVIGVLLGVLSLGSLLPAALLAPSELGIGGKLVLVIAGLAQSLFVASLLLWLQRLFGERAEFILVLLQTAVFCMVLVGFAAGLRYLPQLAATAHVDGAWLTYPPAWFAALTAGVEGTAPLLGLLAAAFAAATLILAPFPPPPRARRTSTPMSVLLYPLRVLARRLWVRPEERASFELLYEALPAERAFVARTYPLFAVPLAFMLLGAEQGTAKGEGLLALLAFMPVTYLPILLLHVPSTSTPAARWILDVAPLDPEAESGGGRKAFAVRFLAPLYLALAGMIALRGTGELALRLVPVAAATGLLLLRAIWDRFVASPPLSTSAEDLGTAWDDGSSGGMLGIAIGATFAAILSWRVVTSPAAALMILGAVLLLEARPARVARAA